LLSIAPLSPSMRTVPAQANGIGNELMTMQRQTAVILRQADMRAAAGDRILFSCRNLTPPPNLAGTAIPPFSDVCSKSRARDADYSTDGDIEKTCGPTVVGSDLFYPMLRLRAQARDSITGRAGYGLAITASALPVDGVPGCVRGFGSGAARWG
jgi:hypothetical protein